MTNPENLIPFAERTQAEQHAIRVKGGQATKGVFRLRKDRVCGSRCPLYERCIFASESSKHLNTKGRPQCGLANKSGIFESTKHRHIKFLTGGRKDYEELMKGTLAEYQTIVKGSKDPKDFDRFAKRVEGMYKAIYGNKFSMDVKVDKREENIMTQIQQVYVEVIKKDEKVIIDGKHDDTNQNSRIEDEKAIGVQELPGEPEETEHSTAEKVKREHQT